MAAHYDTYDYPAYWEGREYEHASEIVTVKSFLERIEKLETILEIGAGFGRLLKAYSHRAKKIILADPSSKLLKIARGTADSKVKFLHSTVENLKDKIKPKSVDLVVMVRVLHHLQDPETAFKIINHVLKPRGYFILEFPNKKHLKAVLSEFFRGNLTYPLDIFPKDLKTKKGRRKTNLPFINYHPDYIEDLLVKSGFVVEEKRSVSNIRSQFLKRVIPHEQLISLEKILQKPLAYFSFGPSIFLLARKIS